MPTTSGNNKCAATGNSFLHWRALQRDQIQGTQNAKTTTTYNNALKNYEAKKRKNEKKKGCAAAKSNQ